MFRFSRDKELTLKDLADFIAKHKQEVANRYKKLKSAYISDYDILHQEAKPQYKPDNRIVVNFAKYEVDTMNGFFIGNPIKTVSENEETANFVEYIEKYNNQDDNNAELSKICSIYGKGYEMYYADEESNLCITYLSPMDAFMIYDESIVERPLYFVRLYEDYEGNERGSISNSEGVRHFSNSGEIKWTEDDWTAHFFDGIPATEYVENEERQGIFEPVLTMINAYNKAISEKANDVDYFADAYLKILGTLLESDDLEHIRDNRIINFDGDDAQKIIVEFMDKPNNDTAQENLLERLERLIFHISMIANVSDENFGTSSGIALKYKLLSMINLAKTKERKFVSGMNRRYMLLFSHPLSKVPKESWVQLEYQFTPNLPNNILEEADIAAKIEGIVSHETQLKILSIVNNVQTELDKIAEENAEVQETTVEKSMFGGEKASVYEITSVLQKYQEKKISFNNAVRMLVRLGYAEEEAQTIISDKDVVEEAVANNTLPTGV